MGRYTCRVRRDSGFPKKQDTPVKTALSRRDKCRIRLPNKRYEALPEEAEEETSVPIVTPTNPVLPVYCKSVLRLSSPALPESSRGKAVSPAAPPNKKSGCKVSPAGPPTVRMTPGAETFKGGEIKVKEQNKNIRAATPESTSSSSMGSDTTFSSDDDDDEEECYSSATSSSLPSPEIFRNENYVETLAFPMREKQLGLHLHIKNSTLLDVSHAEDIHLHHPPNLSNIIDVSMILPEKNCEINKHRGSEAETKIHTDSGTTAFKRKTPPNLPNRRPILCQKKVWFRSPLITDIFEVKHIPASKFTVHSPSESVQTSSPEISSKEKALRLKVKLKRPVKSSAEKAKFFDFVDDRDRGAFFQRMRERCVKLRSTPLFPLTAAKHKDLSK